MALSRRLGMPWREMLDRMDAEELTYQQAFDEAFDDPDWQQTGMICRTIAATSWSPKNRPITDFMPARRRESQAMTSDQIMRNMGAPPC